MESGSFTFANTPEIAQRLADLIIRELGLDAAHIGRLRDLPYTDLLHASQVAMSKANPVTSGFPDVRQIKRMLHYGPVIDGKILPHEPFTTKGPAMSASVPMIIGTTLNEFTTGINHPEFERMTKDELEAKAETAYPGHGKTIVAAFHAHAWCQAVRPMVAHRHRTGARGCYRSGRRQGGAWGHASLSLLVHMADAGSGRQTARIPLCGNSFCLLQHRSLRSYDGRRRRRALACG